ncbi:venom carboxylesterase-6-like [Uranotaenia lowii]|uniref:venom carboxylesterase-6-like n=1 Tax=Uranotaenia lowii TaxID=190385 RepID=UPI0024783AA7|nr:venom carboxylesterase-6-like [Uranotaenia lowii]
MSKFVQLILRGALALLKYVLENLFVKYWPGVERPKISVRQGQVQGITAKLPNGQKYHYFKGIPYAKPPIGELRFCPPVPLEKFKTPLVKCFVDKSDFIQQDFLISSIVMGQEDALNLNVYTPTLNGKDGGLPVMVFIHGGGMQTGTAGSFLYDPKHFVEQNVVFVTVYYRLGPFGFLYLPSVGVNGNFGLKDQRLALKWVNENIASFAGDPNNVTLFGESAGSWSTYLHYLSPNSRKFFHRVICQSGTACTSSSSLQLNPEGKARKLAKLLGYSGTSDQEVLDTLRKAPARLIAKHIKTIGAEDKEDLFYVFPFQPVIEPAESEEPIIAQPQEQTLKTFDSIQMPIISGYTSGEGILAYGINRHRLKVFNQRPDWLIPRMLGQIKNLDKQALGEQIRQFYLGMKTFGSDSVNEIVNLFGDNTFYTTQNLSSEWLAKYQPNALHYRYIFSFEGDFGIVKNLVRMDYAAGVSHADDLFYMFSPSLLPNLPKERDEYRVREIFISLWTNFAKFGDPTPDERLLGFRWTPVPPIDKESKSFDSDCLEIRPKPRIIRNPFQERKEFWRELIRKYTDYI